MAEKHMSFEERMTARCGAEALAEAKHLLKKGALLGVWRDSNGRLAGRFRVGDGMLSCTADTSGDGFSVCDCGDDSHPLCRHGAALIMYHGSVALRRRLMQEPPPEYYGGLRREDFAQLASRCRQPEAWLEIEADGALPHAPTKWEDFSVQVTIHAASGRTYSGNHSNMQSLFYNHVLNAAVKWEDLSLQEQQIVRFLAVNAEPKSSRLAMDSETFSEFFHVLVGFRRFYRGSRQITVRRETASPVMILNRGKVVPGLLVEGAAFPALQSTIIAGKGGCWIGNDHEYFFVPATVEMTFLRSFFRLEPQKLPAGKKGDKFLAAFPFGVVRTSHPRVLTPKIFLDGTFVDGSLALSVDYVYSADGLSIGMPSHSGSLLVGAKRAWKRDVELENGFETALDLFGFAVSGNSALLPKDDTLMKPGVFLDETLPQLARTYPQLVLGASLGRLSGGGSGLPELLFHCKYLEGDEEKSTISYSFGGLVPETAWHQVAAAAENRSPFIVGSAGPVRLGEPLARLMRALPSASTAVDPTRGTFDLPRCSAGYYLKLAGSVPGAAVPELFSGLPPSVSTPTASDFEMTGTLRRYQSEGVAFMQWMTDRNLGVLLADEMGLGKTVQVLALVASRRHRNDPPVLVLCPTSLIANWERETARFVPGLRVSAPIGRERSRDIADVGTYDVLVMSYAAARNSTAALSAVRFSYIVLDEAQHIKNPGTDNAKICKNLSGAHRIVLSGTPLENSPEDLWSIFDFLQPGMLGTLAGFRRRYAGIEESEELRADLLARVSPFILRRTKAQVASDLPERSERIVYCDFGPEQRRLYDKLVEESRTRLGELRSSGKRNGVDVLALLMRIRQLCCHPELLPEGAGNGVPSAKTELLMELLQENMDSSHKVLVFSQFPTFLRLLIPLLEKDGIRYEYLDGATRDRQERIDRFNSDPGIPVFLLSLKAGGTGFNLTSADRVIIYDPWWNPAAELQAADRTHRIGQTKPVTTTKLVARGTIEEKILSMQSGKLRLFESLVVSGEKLSIDDIAALLDGEGFN